MSEQMAKYETSETAERTNLWELVTMWKCPYCETTFPSMSRFCPDCGEQLWDRKEG